MKKKRPMIPKLFSVWHELLASPDAPLPLHQRTEQLTRMYAALHSLEQDPVPTLDDWKTVSEAVNMLEALIKNMKVCEDESGLLDDAMQAMVDAGKRYIAGQNIRLSGKGIQSVRAVLESYADMVNTLPARTMMQCFRVTEQRMSEILAGKTQPHDVTWSKT